MGYDLEDAEAQAYTDMAWCARCGGNDPECKAVGHQNNERVQCSNQRDGVRCSYEPHHPYPCRFFIA